MVSSRRLHGQLCIVLSCPVLSWELCAAYMSWKRMLARSNAFDASERSIAASMISCNPENVPLVDVK
jgi:hypothetical protein